VLLASGVAKAVQGEAGEARVRLTRALRLAHGTVANHQLVAQSLGLLGSLTAGPAGGEVQVRNLARPNQHL
jgi:MAternally-affected-uncoordination protein